MGDRTSIPLEVEGLLNEHPKVSAISIVAMPDKEFGEKRCAYVVPKPGEIFTFSEMAQFLKEKKLAMYKLPERLEIIEAMPTVGDSGKIDKKVLKKQIEETLAAEGNA